MEMQMFLTRKNQSRKQLLQTMDGELDMVEALGLCTATMKRPRKEQGADQKKEVPRGGEMVTEVGTILRSKNVCVQVEQCFSSFSVR